MTIEESKQSLSAGKRVELFDFDAREIGGNLYNFVSSFKESGNIRWKGLIYTPIPIKADGFEVSSQGTLPTPRLQISNILLIPGSIINSMGDPLGAKITRWVTFEQYLDDGASPSADDYLTPQVFYVERKVSQNRVYVEFELSSIMDQHGRQLPKRQVLRDACPLIYRQFDSDANAFDYSKATCPYAGSSMFKANGDITTDPSQDRCGKRLTECKKRFGSDPLPFGGFPGVARIR